MQRGFDLPREYFEAGIEAEQDELRKLDALRNGKASDGDIIGWIEGLMTALAMTGTTRAEGDEWIDPAYMQALKTRLQSSGR